MDGFGDSFVPPTEGGTEVDPAAEFLAREQDQLAGLDDDIVPSTDAAVAEESQPPQPGQSVLAYPNSLYGFNGINFSFLSFSCAFSF